MRICENIKYKIKILYKQDTQKEDSKPSYWIDELKSQTHPINAKHCIRRFIPAINANPASFVKEFGELDGMDHLIKLISFSHADDDLRQAFLEAIKAILDSPNDVGFNLITDHSHIIQAIVNMFESRDTKIKFDVYRFYYYYVGGNNHHIQLYVHH